MNQEKRKSTAVDVNGGAPDGEDDDEEEIDVKKMKGIPYGLNTPFERAIKAITGEETYYRWDPPAPKSSGSTCLILGSRVLFGQPIQRS